MKSLSNTKTEIKLKEEYRAKAEEYVGQIEALISPTYIKAAMYSFLKLWNRVYDQIIVNLDQVNEIAALIKRKREHVVLLPTHKSFMDLWIIGFIHLQQGIEYPFVTGNQSIFGLAFISTLFKQSGAINLEESNMKNEFFKIVFDGYLSALMKNNQLVELFLEKRRSRSGKI